MHLLHNTSYKYFIENISEMPS